MGVCLAANRVAAAFGPGAHGTTFGGNPLAMAVGNAVLDIILGDGFLANVNKVSAHLDARIDELLRRFPGAFESKRGKGLMRGLKCASGVVNTEMVEQLRGVGLLTVGAADNTIRLLPPLIVTNAEIDSAIDMLAAVAAQAKAA
jgi:acetylornithine/N-succinyldiaminopimelate aminotransferase